MMKVSIIMGSDSDLPVMKEAAEFLESLHIPCEITIVSAHRTPKRLYEYAESAKARGISVIIAGAGGAAHLPGMVASLTTLPVIGVPIQTKTLNGVDSLYSIVQMPPGIPVAAVAVNGAKNAGILAASILSVYDEQIAEKLNEYKKSLNKMVHEKADRLEQAGYISYLNGMGLTPN
jgi:5-(carboxyamino)imidazole ribonucleotide mutase